MVFLSVDYLFHRIDLAKKPRCQHLKFQRAFQFLQLLLLQRVYGIDNLPRSITRRSGKPKCEFQVFLGGSCNPTTWRYELAIPYFRSRSISCYNPQVANWTPDLVETEHRVKESAPLLFFVIDHSTRSLAAIAEVSYLAARRRDIIVVMNPMPEERNQTKFIEEKTSTNEKDIENDYENVCEARRTLRLLLQSINIPVFDDVQVALECAVFLVKQNEDQSRQTLSCTNESDESNLSQSSSPIYSCDNKHFRFLLIALQSFFILCTFPFRWLENFLPFLCRTNSFDHSPSATVDLYIASGEQDEHWLNTIVLPLLQARKVSFIKRELSAEIDQVDIHLHKRSRLIYYLINDNERLSHLTTELAFLIGEQQHQIIVYLQSKIKKTSEEILSKNERDDIERSRKYLEHLARKEKISLYQSREESWREVLAICLQN